MICRKCRVDKSESDFPKFPNGRRMMYCSTCGGSPGETLKHYQIRLTFRRAILAGEIVNPRRCSICGNQGRIVGHHSSYMPEDALKDALTDTIRIISGMTLSSFAADLAMSNFILVLWL